MALAIYHIYETQCDTYLMLLSKSKYLIYLGFLETVEGIQFKLGFFLLLRITVLNCEAMRGSDLFQQPTPLPTIRHFLPPSETFDLVQRLI